MGAVDFLIDAELVAVLKEQLPLRVFVETGTFEGESIRRVRAQFEEIHSVESSPEYYTQAVSRFRDDPKVSLHFGHSPEILRKLAPSLLGKSVLYWLDAHWCVADYIAGDKSQCPLLDELSAISSLNEQSVILIDDARLFLCPPPRPHEVSQWPSFNSILKCLGQLASAHEVMILNDVLIFYPTAVREALAQYAYDHSINWLTVLDKSRDYDLLLAQLKEKEAVIRNLASSVERASEMVKEKEAAIHNLADSLARASAMVEEKETAIRDLAAALQEKETAIRDLAASLEEKEGVIWDLAVACETRLTKMNELAEEVKRLRASGSAC
jgi:hypothetical protein